MIAYILIDTGALQGNYTRRGVFEVLKSSSELLYSASSSTIVENFELTKTCTLTSCFECSKVASTYLNFKNILKSEIETTFTKAHTTEEETLSYDLILGRPSITESNILSKTPIQGSDYEVCEVSKTTTKVSRLSECCESCACRQLTDG